MKIAILGSGPSALACALSIEQLVIAGDETFQVEIIDAGGKVRLDEQRKAPGPAGKMTAAVSDAFRIPDSFRMSSSLEGEMAGSSAFGGWSNIWGGTILRYTQWGLSHWKFENFAIQDSYMKLEHLLPKFRIEPGQSLLRRIPRFLATATEFTISGRKCSIGPSNLAISEFSPDQRTGCNQCGECLSGCPANHIWNAGEDWERLFSSENFGLLSNEWVEKVSETAGKVRIESTDDHGDTQIREYDRVFVGLGAIQSGALMIRSGIARSPVLIRDSRMILAPFIRKYLGKTGDNQKRVTLSDGFALTTNEDEGDLGVDFFSQIYGYSPEMNLRVSTAIPLVKLLPRGLRILLLSRFGVGMCFFDQEISGTIALAQTTSGTISVTPSDDSALLKLCKKQMRHEFQLLGFRALSFLSKPTAVGLGYHFGSSFPLQCEQDESRNDSDRIGRPNGARRIHLVDSSVFPRICSTPITWTIMANAYRITSESLNPSVT